MQPIICQKEFIKYTIFKFQLHKGGFGYRTGSAVHHQQPPCVCLFHSLVSCSNESKIEKWFQAIFHEPLEKSRYPALHSLHSYSKHQIYACVKLVSAGKTVCLHWLNFPKTYFVLGSLLDANRHVFRAADASFTPVDLILATTCYRSANYAVQHINSLLMANGKFRGAIIFQF